MPQVRLLSKRLTGLLLVLSIIAVVLTGCSPGGLFSAGMMYAPHRALESDAEVFQSALTALAEGDRAGQIILSEDEFSSLLRAALVDDVDDQGLVRDVNVWMEPDTIYLKIILRDGTIPRVPTGVALNIEGGLRTGDGRLQFDLERAGVGVIPILSPALRELLESQLDIAVRRLVDRASPLEVAVGSGEITIDVP